MHKRYLFIFLAGVLFSNSFCKGKTTKKDSDKTKTDKVASNESYLDTIRTNLVQIKSSTKTDFLPTMESELLEDKNSIYSSSLLFALDGVREVMGEKIEVSHSDKDFQLFVRSIAHKNSLQKDEYKNTFKQTENGFEITASFYKDLPFIAELDSFANKLKFKNSKVKSFGKIGYSENTDKTVKILYYKNDKDFILQLQPKDANNEILLCKNNQDRYQNFSSLIPVINKKISDGEKNRQNTYSSWRNDFLYEDKLIIPVLNFNYEKDFTSFKNKELSINGNSVYFSLVLQRTAFQFNHKGSKIESEAVISVATPAAEIKEEIESETPKPKNLIFDQPFFIILKKKNSANPYFMAYIKNTELMQLEK